MGLSASPPEINPSVVITPLINSDGCRVFETYWAAIVCGCGGLQPSELFSPIVPRPNASRIFPRLGEIGTTEDTRCDSIAKKGCFSETTSCEGLIKDSNKKNASLQVIWPGFSEFQADAETEGSQLLER
jgi:hypothetical protein